MNVRASNDENSAPAPHGWRHALLAVLTGVLAMVVTAALGLWAAGAAGLPGAAFPAVVAAVVVMAAGGSVGLSGDAGSLVGTQADLSVLPLSVTLVGALLVARGFLRPLHHRAVAGGRELAGWAGRVAALWIVALIVLSLIARHTFTLSADDLTGSEAGDLLGSDPKVGFRAEFPLTLVFGLLWLAGVLVLALLVSRRAPLPARLLRFQEAVRPAAFAMVALLLACVALGVVAGLVVMITRGHPAETVAVLLLGLPNLVWLALTLGLGASWEGKVDGPFGLPMPQVLDTVLRTPDLSTLNLSTLAEQDGRVRWLVVVVAVLVLAAAFLMAARSPAGTRLWQHAVHMAVALTLTVLFICLTARISAHYGLSLLGLGDLGGGLGGEVSLRPKLWTALGFAVLWGLVTGFLGGLAASRVHSRGEVRDGGPED
ncbi:streptophobe family protein [Streptomyces sp. JUS-F4]|uniref:streptophobe family protein n=1 Tax=Streptomyces TaxID=1883 RepID=UPI002259616E|nr:MULTISPECIES: streptophobe family protein [Streptomyces]MCX4713613.1 streptophobe family protein [Streptomyces griseus]WKN13067.1 streptophobe family protein [Streptomyces sp. JUS-F4]